MLLLLSSLLISVLVVVMMLVVIEYSMKPLIALAALSKMRTWTMTNCFPFYVLSTFDLILTSIRNRGHSQKTTRQMFMKLCKCGLAKNIPTSWVFSNFSTNDFDDVISGFTKVEAALSRPLFFLKKMNWNCA